MIWMMRVFLLIDFRFYSFGFLMMWVCYFGFFVSFWVVLSMMCLICLRFELVGILRLMIVCVYFCDMLLMWVILLLCMY